MVKTHNVTGIKYLCQTQRKNPFKYLGSGVAWGRHLKNNGEDITTEVIGTYETKEELNTQSCGMLLIQKSGPT